eukprot:TRINITY_DN2775_c4_g1_i2.p1 TRINITY_DN2775_c4_g1~~TRINITY_DN2775_c4_g1_i2.p1  ORF type:complete len:255 (-),score=77.88 TRINITY_DN2775_c4_g1_i2:39-803(-)
MLHRIRGLKNVYGAYLNEFKSPNPAVDPAILRIAVYHSIIQQKQIQIKFNSELKAFFRDVLQIEFSRIETIKAITKEFVTESNGHFSKIAKDITIAGQVIDSIDAQADWSSFCKTKNLTPAKEDGTATTFEEILPSLFLSPEDDTTCLQPFKHKDILKAGKMELSGLFRWTEYYFVVSRFGFFHRYPTSDQQEPEESLPLEMCHIVQGDKSPPSFQLTYTPPSYFSTNKTFTFRTTTPEDLTDWLQVLKPLSKK